MVNSTCMISARHLFITIETIDGRFTYSTEYRKFYKYWFLRYIAFENKAIYKTVHRGIVR